MKILQKRLYEFAEINSLLPKFQFGFRKHHSTTAAACLLYEIGYQCLNSRKRLYACFFDFKKAFDLVDRSLLLTKLQLLGIPNAFCSVLFHILSNLKLHVRNDSTVSEPFTTLNGVPQGDALSPLLFSLFTSDMPLHFAHKAPHINNIKVPYILFADDLVLLAESKSELQTAVDSVSNYCKDFNISINVTKTKYMVFHKGRLPTGDSSITLSGNILTNCNNFCYLGFNFTTQLSFSKHAIAVSKKADAKIGILFSKLKLHQLPLPLVLEVFRVYILPMFTYGLFIWFPHLSLSAKNTVYAVFSKFLKRYLRVPKHSSNELTYFIANCEPLEYTLRNLLQGSFLSLKLPSEFSGFMPHSASFIPNSIEQYNSIEHVPSYFWHSAFPGYISTNPSFRHSAFRLTYDSVHYDLCSKNSFHKLDAYKPCECLCKFCGQACPFFFHFQECPAFIL